jgi:hypothetical protein
MKALASHELIKIATEGDTKVVLLKR